MFLKQIANNMDSITWSIIILKHSIIIGIRKMQKRLQMISKQSNILSLVNDWFNLIKEPNPGKHSLLCTVPWWQPGSTASWGLSNTTSRTRPSACTRLEWDPLDHTTFCMCSWIHVGDNIFIKYSYYILDTMDWENFKISTTSEMLYLMYRAPAIH